MRVVGVKCDEDGCGWKNETADIVEWIKKPCPKCGKGEIITEDEVKMLDVLRGLESFGKLMFPNAKTKEVRLDIGPMRKGEAPEIV